MDSKTWYLICGRFYNNTQVEVQTDTYKHTRLGVCEYKHRLLKQHTWCYIKVTFTGILTNLTSCFIEVLECV